MVNRIIDNSEAKWEADMGLMFEAGIAERGLDAAQSNSVAEFAPYNPDYVPKYLTPKLSFLHVLRSAKDAIISSTSNLHRHTH